MILRRIQPIPLLWLTIVWVLLWGNLSWANVLGGLVLGALVLLVFPLPPLIAGVTLRPGPTLSLLAHFLIDLVEASLRVAWLTVRPGPAPVGVVLDVPLRSKDTLLLTVTAELVGLIPGTVVIDLDSRSGIVTVHALEARTPADARAVRDDLQQQEDRVLRALARDPEGTGPAGPRTGAHRWIRRKVKP